MVKLSGLAWLVIAFLCVIVFSAGSPSYADPTISWGDQGDRSGPSTSTTQPSPGPSDSTHTGRTTVTQEAGCSIKINSYYFGPACPSSGGTSTGKVLTIKEILGHDSMPDCWDTPLTDTDLNTYRVTNSPNYTWYLRKCLTWTDPNPIYPYPSDAQIADALVALPTGSAPLTLTANQQVLVDQLSQGQGSYPTVLAIPAGAGVARVNVALAFHGAPAETKTVHAGPIYMKARVLSLIVKPLGKNAPDATQCDDAGAIPPAGATYASTTDNSICWYTFRHSSADQPDQAYPMSVTVTWDVRSSPDPNAAWENWKTQNNSIQITHITNQKVTEIQTVVVQ